MSQVENKEHKGPEKGLKYRTEGRPVHPDGSKGKGRWYKTREVTVSCYGVLKSQLRTLGFIYTYKGKLLEGFKQRSDVI